MGNRIGSFLLALTGCGALTAAAADIVLAPPSSAGVAITNAAGNTIRFRVADDGTVSLPGPVYKGTQSFLHNFGTSNTFLGLSAGNFTMSGGDNTAQGASALPGNTTGHSNTAIGRRSMLSNTSGRENTALGMDALHDNDTGAYNVAVGNEALYSNLGGAYNTAAGLAALRANTTGLGNAAVGHGALEGNTTGHYNVAFGLSALSNSVTGIGNVAIGKNALLNATGSGNIALGQHAGLDTTGSNNIAIGNEGVADESSTIRFGSTAHTRTFIAGIRGRTTGVSNAIAVMIDSSGQLGTVSSSGRFKDDIADMDDASSDLMKLRPVTFHYLADQDPAGRTLQYGLVAEEVAQVYPGLVARSNDGEVETVMYQFLPSMLLNEVQKLRRDNDRLSAEIAEIRQMLRNPR